MPAIRRPRHAAHILGLALAAAEQLAAGRLPHPRRAIPTRGSQARSIRRPRHAAHLSRRASAGAQERPPGGLPHSDRSIFARRSHPTAIGCPGHTLHPAGMPLAGAQQLAANGLPDPHGSIPDGGGHRIGGSTGRDGLREGEACQGERCFLSCCFMTAFLSCESPAARRPPTGSHHCLQKRASNVILVAER